MPFSSLRDIHSDVHNSLDIEQMLAMIRYISHLALLNGSYSSKSSKHKAQNEDADAEEILPATLTSRSLQVLDIHDGRKNHHNGRSTDSTGNTKHCSQVLEDNCNDVIQCKNADGHKGNHPVL